MDKMQLSLTISGKNWLDYVENNVKYGSIR